MPGAVVYEDPEGERALDEEVVKLRRRRLISRVGILVVLAGMAAFVWWPLAPCEALAQRACKQGLLHCGRSRAALSSGALEEAECAALVEGLDGKGSGAAARELKGRLLEANYTPDEQEAIRRNPKRLP